LAGVIGRENQQTQLAEGGRQAPEFLHHYFRRRRIGSPGAFRRQHGREIHMDVGPRTLSTDKAALLSARQNSGLVEAQAAVF